MTKLLGDIVRFRGDKLFNGAVNIEWFETDELKAAAASSAFVFHGPAYHGVSQADVGISHGHRLQDTASFTRAICRRCYGLEEQPFTLAIAGYGTGKSHLALTIATLLADPIGTQADQVISGIGAADQRIATDIKTMLAEIRRPCLVVALNGMKSFDLAAEVFRQIMHQVKKYGLDTRLLDELRPRFAQASSLIRMAMGNKDVIDELLVACDVECVDEVLRKLEEQDDAIYEEVYNVLASRNIKISVLGGESVRDVIAVSAREYCGHGKPFHDIVILFDEFGRYTEFATIKSHVAGSGVLQDLFEAVQGNAGSVCFVGFIQFELNAYVQRVAPEQRNEILRYVTRYQTANKVYLSINLETLIANLIEKKNQTYLSDLLDNDVAINDSKSIVENISKWFPVSLTHPIWSDADKFHNVIRKGCWPLSPYSTWLLFYLAAGGKHLQERSVLALIGEVFDRYQDSRMLNGKSWIFDPVDLWSEEFQQELITSEEGGQLGAVTHSYASVLARYGAQFTDAHIKILRSIVLASKLGLKVANQDDAVEALSELSGLLVWDTQEGIRLLREEFNIIEWDEAFKQFEVLGDAVPRTQFLAFIRQRVASTYDENGKSALFANKANKWCDLLSDDLECDFAEENKITTREWRYQAVCSNLDILPMHVKLAADRWLKAIGVDEPRGTIIYCYVESRRDVDVVERDASKLLRQMGRELECGSMPILIVLISDGDGKLGQSLAELAIMEESLNEQEIARFGNLVGAHKQKMRNEIRSRVEDLIKERRYVTAFKEPLESSRLGRVGSEIFTKIYKSLLIFPFDGFTTAKGNAATTCRGLITDLLQGRLDWNSVMVKPKMEQNRATTVLRDAWGVFAKNGTVRTRPEQPIVRALTEKWDEMLAIDEKRILLQDGIKKLCAPPYGANIASAGLFLGVFAAARTEKLSIVKSGQTLSLQEWMHEEIFRGNLIDINALYDVELLYSGQVSSEWERLLDDWEEAETYAVRRDCYIQAEGLKERIPVPSSQAYREMLLEKIGKEAFVEIKKVDDVQESAIGKMERGLQRDDLASLTKGAVELHDLIARMASQKPLWTDHEIDAIKPFLERSRQSIIQLFPEWLKSQTPNAGSPDSVGEFKYKMIHVVGAGLLKLKLEALQQQLLQHTAVIIRKAETIASAHQIVREVGFWVTTNEEAIHFVRVARLRALQNVGKDYVNKLAALEKEISLPEITEIRMRLSAFIENIKQAKKSVEKRASMLWDATLEDLNDAEKLLDEVDGLISVYEGCDDDIDEMQLLRKILRVYIGAYNQLNDNRLTSTEFESLAAKLKDEATRALQEDMPPWEPEETIDNFRKTIAQSRAKRSLEWIQELEGEASNVESLSAADANVLYTRISSPPSILEVDHQERLQRIGDAIESRLSELKIEWLIEKFLELSAESQQQFLAQIQK